MTRQKTVKGWDFRCLLVGVVTSDREISAALKLPTPPDLFELRLDHFWPNLDELENRLPQLSKKAALLITARDPAEGGVNNLRIRTRRELLLRFVPHADFIDAELRTASRLEDVLAAARRQGLGLVLSFHDFKSTPSLRRLQAKARDALRLQADVFKVATRTNTNAEMTRLLDFFSESAAAIPTSAMGIGRMGLKTRQELARRGSALIYGSVGSAKVRGQPTLSEIHRWNVHALGR